MIETDSMNFIIAIIFTTSIIVLVVGMYGYNLVVSGNRLRKAQRLAAAAIDSTPAALTIVFDAHERVAVFKTHNSTFAASLGKPYLGKERRELRFLPEALQTPAVREDDSHPGLPLGKHIAPFQLQDGRTLYIEWEMQDFMSDDGNTEFRIARGCDVTTELIQSQKKLKVFSASSLEREEQERKRIAEDLHDSIGEILTGSKRALEKLKQDSPSPAFSQEVEAIDRMIDKFTKATRSLIFDLIPPALYDFGLTAAVESLAADMKKSHAVTIRVEPVPQENQPNQELAIFLFKSIRECILNAIRHGGADEMLISLSRSDRAFEVIVQDNGSGFESGTSQLLLKADSGFGLFNMKNRAEYYGGGLEIEESKVLGGAQIMVWVLVEL